MQTTFGAWVAAIAVATLAGPTAQAANIVTGAIYYVSDALAGNAIPGNLPGGTPDVTFSAPSPLSFDSRIAATQDIGGFLATGGATGIVYNTGNASHGFGPALFDFVGTVSVVTNQVFTTTHDDGVTLIIGGLTVIAVPGPTGPSVTSVTYTGPTGTFAFELVYGECCSAPAVLQIDLPLTSVAVLPEPASAVLLGAGLLGLGWVRRRRG